PASNKNIDEFFFKNLAPSSQLFTIACGIELGNFYVNENNDPEEIGIEIILENPEFFPKVEMTKEPKYEIDVNGLDTAQKKWQKDLVRHFADPAAFYGLHHDVKGGIEYRQGTTKPTAITPIEVYQNIIAKFQTKSTVYLDIRNENGYSYNYYDNYVGTIGPDADKELKIGQTSGGSSPKEYYTDGWAIHKVDITLGSGTENEFFIALRVNDNERPLLAGWSVELTPNSVVDPPLIDNASSRIYFTDETGLLPTPIPNPLPEFTNEVSIKVPNLPSESAQLATIVKLDYIKQLRLNDGVDSFPQHKSTDYLFGPITTQIPWDSEDSVQWIGSNHNKYFDGWLNNGFASIAYLFSIKNINYQDSKIILNGLVADLVPLQNYSNVLVRNTNGILLGLVISDKIEISLNNETSITITRILDANNPNNQYTLNNSGLSIGDLITCNNFFNVIINYDAQALYVSNLNLSSYNQYFPSQPKIILYSKIEQQTPSIYLLHSISFNSIHN
ncbi:MAG: hypothetical protein Q8K02_18510, partial [Flavobacterium sp.]|nr:hypothetical protein [Flavobacterium sp.]